HRMVDRHLPPLDRVLGVAKQLAHERAQRVPAEEGGAGLPIGRVEPVSGPEGLGGADMRRFLAQRGQVEPHPPLTLQPQHPLVEDPDGQDRPEQPAQLIARQRRFALGVDHLSVVVDDADDFQLHDSPGARIIGRLSTCQGRPHNIPMSIKVRDIVSFAGRDYVVEGTASYQINGRTTVLARAVDGEVVLWVESPHAPGAGDRVMVLREVRDLELAVPPPESISYHDLTYVQR